MLRHGFDTSLPGAHGPAARGRATRYVGSHQVWGLRPPARVVPEGVTRFDLAAQSVLWRAITADVAAGRAAIAAVVG